MKILYTCITNGYDTLKEVQADGFVCICFTDQDLVSDTWQIVRIENREKIFREIKICPRRFLPEHDVSVWMDGNISPVIDLSRFVSDKKGYWVMTHPERDCIYTEAMAAIHLKKDSSDVIEKQIRKYRLEHYPAHNGMVGTGVMVRENRHEYISFAEMWWQEVKQHSVRDQLSFNYCAWKTNFHFNQFKFLDGFNKNRHHKPADEKVRFEGLPGNRIPDRRQL